MMMTKVVVLLWSTLVFLLVPTNYANTTLPVGVGGDNKGNPGDGPASVHRHLPIHFSTLVGDARLLHASSRPWRHGASDKNDRRGGGYPSFLTWKEVQKDLRVRPWNIDKSFSPSSSGSATTFLTSLNIACFVLQKIFPSITEWGIQRSDLLRKGRGLYRLVTSSFLHGDLPHLLTNMISLRDLGPQVENYFGSGRFVSLYLISGVIGSMLSGLINHHRSLGASGSVFGLLGAYVIFHLRHQWLMMGGQMFFRSFISLLVLEVLPGIVRSTNQEVFGMGDNTDHLAHFGGMLGGFLLAYGIGPRIYVTSRPNRRRPLKKYKEYYTSPPVTMHDGEALILVDRPLFRFPRSIERILDVIVKLVAPIGKQWRQFMTSQVVVVLREGEIMDHSQNYAFLSHLFALHFICIRFALYLHFA